MLKFQPTHTRLLFQFTSRLLQFVKHDYTYPSGTTTSTTERSSNGAKYWTKYVEPIEPEALTQIESVQRVLSEYSKTWSHHSPLPIAVMPDVHLGKGATVGTVIPMKKAIIPAAVGVDIGCGMCAVKTSLAASDLKSLKVIRESIEKVIPLGMTSYELSGNVGSQKKDSECKIELPQESIDIWNAYLKSGYSKIISSRHIKKEYLQEIEKMNNVTQLGTLGSGNHFIEICLDETNTVWIMLHSGSRGVGNAIGRVFIDIAREDMMKSHGSQMHNVDKNLAYLREGTRYFDEYWFALNWASEFAKRNRQVMMNRVIDSLRKCGQVSDPNFKADLMAINCHHNYAQLETHFGEEVYVTRKGAVSARKGEYGIIPGSMGAKSYIVIGKGNEHSYHSCSHGAGRTVARRDARKRFTVQDMEKETLGVECRKDSGVLDEIPSAYKDIDAVMDSQKDLVDVVHVLKQIVCVKG
ncbi:hypothetical protein C9374_004658 [Naegleria lovaniensis]|uniref:3'-phosphate/5'-hydroxy nucleic acid ligase n=1 Tax=Naegleria lovaniensis TaxID=51637 RepID=A0AA88GQA3_NAELO|nr:uncharacterized protein C9374_004658 [Naegleria lovaniensis]KAG2383321.1 hypothetical protein C9374_004658 [Naegleria lovaniensis]